MKKIKIKDKKYCEENKEKRKQQARQWREENKEKRNRYFKEKRKTDPIFKLTQNIRNSINNSLRKKNYSKNTRTYKIIGSEYKDLYQWLNSKASNGLDYDKDNVQVDHVIPVSFGKTENEIIALNHYSNFQLLTASDNLEKNNFYIKKENIDRVFNHHPNTALLTKILFNYDYELY